MLEVCRHMIYRPYVDRCLLEKPLWQGLPVYLRVYWIVYSLIVTEVFFSFTVLQKYPDALVPSFKPTVVKLYDQCIELSVRILEAMGYALGLKVCTVVTV